MATTLATRKQSEAIRDRMRQIRSDLPYDVDDAREQVKQLSDWKSHFARHPLPVLAAAVVVGYVIVPSKNRSERPVIIQQADSNQVATLAKQDPAKKGIIGGIIAAAGTMLLRQAVSLATDHVAKKFNQGNPS